MQKLIDDHIEDAAAALPAAKAHHVRMREALERDHYGSYVMIDTETAEFVVAQTTTQVHAKFIERFGENASGWCTRIGASVFAVA